MVFKHLKDIRILHFFQIEGPWASAWRISYDFKNMTFNADAHMYEMWDWVALNLTIELGGTV